MSDTFVCKEEAIGLLLDRDQLSPFHFCISVCVHTDASNHNKHVSFQVRRFFICHLPHVTDPSYLSSGRAVPMRLSESI